MAKNDNLIDLMVDVADAIRAKEGSSELINPQDFSTRIANLSGGGSGGGVELEGEYFIDKPNNYWKFSLDLPSDLTCTISGYFKYSSFVNLFAMAMSTYECVLYDGTRCLLKFANGIVYDHNIKSSADYNIYNRVIAIVDGTPDCSSLGEILGIDVDLLPQFNTIIEMWIWLYEMVGGGTMTEEELLEMFSSEACTQRITKEEYESLITA